MEWGAIIGVVVLTFVVLAALDVIKLNVPAGFKKRHPWAHIRDPYDLGADGLVDGSGLKARQDQFDARGPSEPRNGTLP